jgi:nucleoside-diphosphate-sugar epimerase
MFMKRFFLTGGTGLIGSHFINQAHAEGYEIIAHRRSDSSMPRFPLENEPIWITAPFGSLPEGVFKDCDTLVHLAAHGVNPATANWRECFHWNVSASLDLWLSAIQAGISNLVVCGSCFEYGASGERFDFIPVDAPLIPTGPYHASKAAASLAATGLAVSNNLKILILRPFHVYGPGEDEGRFWPSLKLAALEGRDFPMTQGTQVRDFVPVSQVAARFVESLTRTDLTAGRPLVENIGTGNPQTLREFAESEWLHFGAQGKLRIGEIPMRDHEVMRFVPELPAAPLS